jgi:hypothetical protein
MALVCGNRSLFSIQKMYLLLVSLYKSIMTRINTVHPAFSHVGIIKHASATKGKSLITT